MSRLIPKLRRPFRRPSHLRLADEGGWLIVEVMVSALVLVIAALAILNGLDGASKASGANRNRSEAAAIAQQDQERLRSFESSGLSNYHTTRTVVVGNLKYKVDSRVEWVRDSSGVVSCSIDSSQAQYQLITSTVTDPTSRNKPIVAQSLVAPHVGDFSTNTGTAAVQLIDRNGTGLPGVTVGLAEPPTPSDVTNSAGCVVFGFLPVLSPGPYHAVFSKAGYVDPLGNTSIGPSTSTGAVTLVAGQTSLTQFQYDAGANLTVSFDTQPTGASVPQASNAFTVNVFNTGIPLTPSQRSFDASTAPTTRALTVPATNLFPFTSSYGVWSGPSGCAAANPATWTQTVDSITMAPGGNQTLTVRQPAINLIAKDNGTAKSGLNVRVSPQSSGCGTTTTYPKQVTTATGALTDPGFPYGDYSICIDNGVRKTSTSTNVQNRTRAGTSAVTLNIASSVGGSTLSGTCT